MKNPWTETQIETLKEMYPNTLNSEIAAAIGRNQNSVENKAHALGLKKTREFISETSRCHSSKPDHGGRKSRFQKGIIPHSKGKKQTEFMSAEGIERTKATRFHKGNTPHNHREIGSERITKDGYIEIKIAEPNKWKLKHRHIWETENGPIPKGMILIFKDNNSQNITTENLQLISKAENMKRNTIHNYPPELKKAIKLTNKIKRKINSK